MEKKNNNYILIIIGLCIIAGVIAYFVTTSIVNGGSKPSTATTSSTNNYQNNYNTSYNYTSDDLYSTNSIDTTDNTISTNTENSTNTTSTSTTSTQKKTSYNVGETYQDYSRKITFVSLDEDFTGYNSYATVKDGCKVLRAEFEFENLGSSTFYVSQYDFNCYADGYDCDSFYSVDDDLSSASLSKNKKTKGFVYFEVPEDATDVTLEYEINSYRDEKVEFKVR